MSPLAIDLFCGLGGWTEGFLAEGWEVVGFDIERHIYGEHRYPAQLVLQDVRTLHGSQFRDADAIVASSPCQKYSYMAMPWTKSKNLIKWYSDPAHPERLGELNDLFEQPRRIQREAIEAAGRFIPLVQENVRGAIPWVGRSQWHYGSYHLWGDIPALMPVPMKAAKLGNGHSWYPPSDERHTPGLDFTRLAGKASLGDGIKAGDRNKGRANGEHKWTADFAEAGQKNTGGSWFNIGSPGQKVLNVNPVHDGTKIGGDWFSDPTSTCRQHGSKSKARKAASARIAKIPFPLASYIARTFKPECF